MFSESKTNDEKKKIIKKSFKFLAVSALQSIWVTTKTEERVRQLIKLEPIGLDTLKKCLEKKGEYFFLPHITAIGK